MFNKRREDEEPDLMQLLEELKNASPEEKEQLKALLSLLGITPAQIMKLEAAFAPKSPFRDKQKALDNLDRDFGRAVAENVDNLQRMKELKRIYEEEKRKILES
jgi:hypothetical protein